MTEQENARTRKNLNRTRGNGRTKNRNDKNAAVKRNHQRNVELRVEAYEDLRCCMSNW